MQLRDLLLQDPLGVTLTGLAEARAGDDMIAQSFSDCFRMKASSTIQNCASSLEQLFKILRQRGCLTPLRMTEIDLYGALCHLRNSGAGATSAQHAIEALRFIDSTVRLRLVDLAMVISGCCKGVARDMYLKKDPFQQKHPLSVVLVERLENIIHVLPLRTQVICGQLLFCAHACCRWKDAQNIKSISIERGHEECLGSTRTFIIFRKKLRHWKQDF